MGVCSSCLGLRSRDSQGDPSETSRLLNSRNPQARYDGGSSDERGDLDFETIAEPHRERHERDTLTGIWKLTSDHLVDVTQGTSIPGDHTSTTDDEFAVLFHEVFYRSTRSNKQSASQGAGAPNHVSVADFGSSVEDDDHDSENEQEVNEQEWLREIILQRSGDDKWDCNRVHRIGRPLLINFDDS